MTIKYHIKDFFGHPQANTLSDINITRVILILEYYISIYCILDAIKTISQNSSGGPDEFPAIIILLIQCSKSLAHPLQRVVLTFSEDRRNTIRS